MTKTERRVSIHPKSVNADERFFSSPWFVYHLKLKTVQVSLFQHLYSLWLSTWLFNYRYIRM